MGAFMAAPDVEVEFVPPPDTKQGSLEQQSAAPSPLATSKAVELDQEKPVLT